MKKIIIALILLTTVSFYCKAQPGSIDTVTVSNFTMKASEWAYYVSYLNGSKDSVDLAFIRSVRARLQSTANLTWNTNVTMPAIAGRYVIAIYDIGRRIPGGEAIILGVSALNTISAITHPVIQYYIGSVDSRYTDEYNRHRQLGKNLLLDN